MPVITVEDQGLLNSSDAFQGIARELAARTAQRQALKQQAEAFPLEQRKRAAEATATEADADTESQMRAITIKVQEALAKQREAEAARSQGTLGADIETAVANARKATIEAGIAAGKSESEIRLLAAQAETAVRANYAKNEETTVTNPSPGIHISTTKSTLTRPDGTQLPPSTTTQTEHNRPTLQDYGYMGQPEVTKDMFGRVTGALALRLNQQTGLLQPQYIGAGPLAPGAQNSQNGPVPTPEHIAILRARPETAEAFDKHYGQGAAQKYLTQQSTTGSGLPEATSPYSQ